MRKESRHLTFERWNIDREYICYWSTGSEPVVFVLQWCVGPLLVTSVKYFVWLFVRTKGLKVLSSIKFKVEVQILCFCPICISLTLTFLLPNLVCRCILTNPVSSGLFVTACGCPKHGGLARPPGSTKQMVVHLHIFNFTRPTHDALCCLMPDMVIPFSTINVVPRLHSCVVYILLFIIFIRWLCTVLPVQVWACPKPSVSTSQMIMW